MNMIRFILLILLVWILWRFSKRWYKNVLQKLQNDAPPLSKLSPMVRCNYCGLYFPKEEAYGNDQVYYCCEKHQQLSVE